MDAGYAQLVLELTASVLTIWQIKLYGDVDRRGPVVGICATVVWCALVWVTEMHGLWPLNIFCLLMHIRNWRLWNGER